MSDDTLVLVGNAKSGTISVLRLEPEALVPVATSEVGEGCGTFAIDHARSLVYCAVKSPEPAIVTLALDRGSGELSPVTRKGIDDPLAYLHLTREGGVLLGASYHGGWGHAWPVVDGVLGEPTERVEHANLHCVVTDAAGEHAYFVSLGEDLVAQFHLDADAQLTLMEEPTVAVTPGMGARHLVLSGDERSAYLVTEYTMDVLRFERSTESGALTLAQEVPAVDPSKGLSKSRFGADPKAEHLIWGADVHVVRDGAFLVASERCESSLTTLALDADGRIGDVVAFAPTETQPRGFNVTPDGERLIVAGEASGQVTLARVTAEGTVEPLDRVATGEGPNWVRLV